MAKTKEQPEQASQASEAAPPERTLLDCCIASGMSRIAAQSMLEACPVVDKETLTKAAMEGGFFEALTSVRNGVARAQAAEALRAARRSEQGKDGDPDPTAPLP